MERCPLDGSTLAAVERVRVETVPATVPDYFSRDREAPYRRTTRYELVRCREGHEFKRTGNALYGMEAEIR